MVLASLFGVVGGMALAPGAMTAETHSDESERTVEVVPFPNPSMGESAQIYNRYRSDRAGFSFAYPTGYELTVGHPEEEPTSFPVPEEYIVFLHQADVTDPEPPFVSIRVYANPQHLSLEAFRDEIGYYVVQEFPDITIAGQRALAFESAGLYIDHQYLFKTPDGTQVVVLHAASEFEQLWQMTEGIRDSFQWE